MNNTQKQLMRFAKRLWRNAAEPICTIFGVTIFGSIFGFCVWWTFSSGSHFLTVVILVVFGFLCYAAWRLIEGLYEKIKDLVQWVQSCWDYAEGNYKTCEPCGYMTRTTLENLCADCKCTKEAKNDG